MSKLFKTVKRNIRVEVEPDYYFYPEQERENRAIQTCNAIVSDIARHVDDVLRTSVVWESVDICASCAHDFEVSDIDCPEEGVMKGQPVCCDEAVVAWKALQ